MEFVDAPIVGKKSSEGISNFSAKPECTTDPECPDHLACITEKCQNPCFTSTCGVNAECRVIKHRATCICNRGYVGDPYRICEERKKYFSIRALTSILTNYQYQEVSNLHAMTLP